MCSGTSMRRRSTSWPAALSASATSALVMEPNSVSSSLAWAAMLTWSPSSFAASALAAAICLSCCATFWRASSWYRFAAREPVGIASRRGSRKLRAKPGLTLTVAPFAPTPFRSSSRMTSMRSLLGRPAGGRFETPEVQPHVGETHEGHRGEEHRQGERKQEQHHEEHEHGRHTAREQDRLGDREALNTIPQHGLRQQDDRAGPPRLVRDQRQREPEQEWHERPVR